MNLHTGNTVHFTSYCKDRMVNWGILKLKNKTKNNKKRVKVFLQQHLEYILGSQKGIFPGWLLYHLVYYKNDTSLFSVQIK